MPVTGGAVSARRVKLIHPRKAACFPRGDRLVKQFGRALPVFDRLKKKRFAFTIAHFRKTADEFVDRFKSGGFAEMARFFVDVMVHAPLRFHRFHSLGFEIEGGDRPWLLPFVGALWNARDPFQ
jgi:hypothetical protein